MIFNKGKNKKNSMLYASITNSNSNVNITTSKTTNGRNVIKRKLVIGITSLKHGTGCSYISIAIANFFRQYKKDRVCVLHGGCGYIDDTLDERADSIYYPCNMSEVYQNYECIIYDCGLNQDSDNNLLDRCDIKIMMCWRNSEYERLLAEFIRSRTDLDNWIFLFSNVPARKNDYVHALMEGYKVFCIPVFDVSRIDKSVVDIFRNMLWE